MNSWLQSLQMHEILIYGLVFGVPIVVVGFSFIETIIKETVKAILSHRERLIMNERELGLDYYPEPPNVAPEQPEIDPTYRPGSFDETQAYTPRC